MSDLQNIPYPYRWQNYPQDSHDCQIYLGKDKSQLCDPHKTANIVNKANVLSKKILSLVETLETKEKEGGWREKLIKPIRYLLEHLPSIQTLQAAKRWLSISQAFEEKNWDFAIDLLQKLNLRKEKEKVIKFPFDSFEDFQNNSNINPRENLVKWSSSVAKASWVKKGYYEDMLFSVYLSLLSTAYFNRALKSDLDEGKLSDAAERDLCRAKVYAQVSGRGLQTYTWAAIKLLENGTPVVKSS